MPAPQRGRCQGTGQEAEAAKRPCLNCVGSCYNKLIYIYVYMEREKYLLYVSTSVYTYMYG